MKPAIALCVFVCTWPSYAAAQDRGRVGITMGYPASIGVLWHLTDSVAVRPELSVSWSSSETGTVEGDGTSLALGGSGLFYLRRWDALSIYVSPRFSFGRTSSETRQTVVNIASETTTRTYLFAAMYGAQYRLGDRFSVFGEVGLGYQRGNGESRSGITGLVSRSTSNVFGTRTGVGLTLYF